MDDKAALNTLLNEDSRSLKNYEGDMLQRRPKLLYLAYYFPPSIAVACVRSWNTAKYLTRLGWDVTVVTPDPSILKNVDNHEGTTTKLRQAGIRLVLSDHRWRCLAPVSLKYWDKGLGWLAGGVCRRIARYLGVDSGIGWIKAAEQACSSLTAKDVDVILATGPPFAAFHLAKRLSVRLDRPYVLDYRDPWTGNPHKICPDRISTFTEEESVLEDSAAVTVVSPSWGVSLHNRFQIRKKLHVITNGFDPEEFEYIEPYDFGHFAIVYAGGFYPPKRVISPVMAAIKRVKETVNGKEWYFHYYGGQVNHVCEEARRFDVVDRVIVHGKASWAKVLSAVRGAGVAVVITSVGEEDTIEERGIMTGKVFEPLGLGTPILIIAPPGSDLETIAETTGLARVYPGSNIEGMASFLREVIFGHVVIAPKDLETYAWTKIAKRLDSVLRAACVNAFSKNKKDLSCQSS